MARGTDPGPTVLAAATPAAADLARALRAASVVEAPEAPVDAGWGWRWDEVLAGWRERIHALPPPDRLVVCTWAPSHPAAAVTDLAPEAWRTRVEWPTALWFTTLVAAADRVVDGGAAVAVAERPATLDAPGHGAEVAVGDGVANLVRSLAAAHGPRGVRVNAVATALHTAPAHPLGAPPRLDGFPGTVADVAGAVRILLSDDASAVTAATLAADRGRR
ncbi:SDR family oxidoreductase [Iamia majanohamensis]|uniref:SDR family oxidoreductase n=1 Tax=Iamia majanohamensis TaxID=467976 RepID=A0AAE9Y5Y1_9ACTN|nr:SDR family oxidoreductase [Iamia majanohamensis]WCO66121.1 SDR family oxidoreductase [Iamia majanohamensis]